MRWVNKFNRFRKMLEEAVLNTRTVHTDCATPTGRFKDPLDLIGHRCKVAFAVNSAIAGCVTAEWRWVDVTGFEQGSLVGTLLNFPLYAPLENGQKVFFDVSDVVERECAA